MSVKVGMPISAVLPLAPMEYDVAYMNNLVRILNFFIKQVNNPGPINGSSLLLDDKDKNTKFNVNPDEEREVLVWIMTNLPTSSTGLLSGQVWNNAGVLSIVP